jgi:hypothetical protein
MTPHTLAEAVEFSIETLPHRHPTLHFDELRDFLKNYLAQAS